MRSSWLAVACVALGLVGCGVRPLAGDDAGAPPDAAPATADAGPPVQGAGCGQDARTGVTLCTAVSLCPTLVVDHDVYPHCGFRLRGEVLDLECFCDGSLCPLGLPATCAQAKRLLDSQTELAVCAQVTEGRCTGGGGGGGGGGGTSCDRNCRAQCAGDPTCIQQCGC